MQSRQPALVYTPGADADTRAAIDDFLHAHLLFRVDDVQEAPEDALLPSVDRPMLRRAMLYAPAGFAEVFVTDRVASLGLDEVSQVAVVGALLSCGLDVVAVEEGDLDGRWYQNKVKAVGFPRIDSIMKALGDNAQVPQAFVDRWREARGGDRWLLPTSTERGPLAARARVRELRDVHRLTWEEIRQCLLVEGYENENERVTWYSQSVRAAYKAAK